MYLFQFYTKRLHTYCNSVSHSPSLSAHTHTNYKYKLPLPLNVRASLASLTFEYRDTHISIVSLHVHTGQTGTDSHARERDVLILCTINWGQISQRKCTKIYGDNLIKCTAALYRTVRKQCTKQYGGNWRRGMVAIWKIPRKKSKAQNTPEMNSYYLRTCVSVCVCLKGRDTKWLQELDINFTDSKLLTGWTLLRWHILCSGTWLTFRPKRLLFRLALLHWGQNFALVCGLFSSSHLLHRVASFQCNFLLPA